MFTCKNCGNQFEGNYCNNCSQPAKTERIDLEFIWEDIEHGLLHYEKGLWYSLKQLFLQPGHAIREYIEGKRIKHFRPLSMLIILATVYGLLYHAGNIKLVSSDNKDSVVMMENIFHHYYWFVVSTIPVYALTTFLLFRGSGYNYSEIFILEAFKGSQRMLVHIFSLFFLYFLSGSTAIKTINFFLIVIDVFLILWSNIQFFKTISVYKIIAKSLLSFALYLFLIIVLAIIYQISIGF